MPQLINQPPQIFGRSYAPDGMPTLPPEIAAQMAFDPTSLLDDPNDAKRRRIARVRLTPRRTEPKTLGRDEKETLTPRRYITGM